MKSLEKNRSIIYAVVIFIVAIIAYNYLLKSSQDASISGISAENIGNDLVVLNTKMQAVTLDPSLFSTPEYRSLTDWSPSLNQEPPKGRINPFAPLGQ